jgi:hypothetical protein
MPLGVKNGPPIYQKAITKTSREYINVFMKIFLDDFTIFSDLSTHLVKLKKFFFNCEEVGISLNPYKSTFIVFSRIILDFKVFEKGKMMNPKKTKGCKQDTMNQHDYFRKGLCLFSQKKLFHMNEFRNNFFCNLL